MIGAFSFLAATALKPRQETMSWAWHPKVGESHVYRFKVESEVEPGEYATDTFDASETVEAGEGDRLAVRFLLTNDQHVEDGRKSARPDRRGSFEFSTKVDAFAGHGDTDPALARFIRLTLPISSAKAYPVGATLSGTERYNPAQKEFPDMSFIYTVDGFEAINGTRCVRLKAELNEVTEQDDRITMTGTEWIREDGVEVKFEANTATSAGHHEKIHVELADQ